MNENRLAVLMLFSAAIFWSTSGVLIKLVALQPLAIAGWRSLIAGGVILLLCRKEVKISWGINALLAAACMGLCCICFVVATKLTTAANAIVLQYAGSVYVAVLAPKMLGEPTRRQDWYFLSLVLSGICLFFMDDLSMRGTLGIFVGILGSIFWSTAGPSPSSSRSSAQPVNSGWGLFSGGYALTVQALESVLIPSIELINPIWVFLAIGEAPGIWAFIGGTLVLAVVTVRGIASAYNGRIAIPPVKPAAVSCAVE